jgi:Fic family protein
MASNDLAIRFTETKYATRSEVSKDLKMSLIDNIWSNILSYRSAFNQYLTLRSVDRNSLLVCFCPTVANSVNELEGKILRVLREYMRMSPLTGDAKHFEDAWMIKSLEYVAAKYDLDVTEPYLRSLVQGDVREISSSHRVLLNYMNALAFIKSKFSSPIDIDFFAELYAKAIGEAELTSFYRTENDKNAFNRVLIDPVYTSAPANLIETLMSELFAFIQNGKTSGLLKGIATYYYINYVRPFPSYNDEVALLMAKAVFAHTGMSELGLLLPLESLLNDKQDVLAKITLEVQKTNDLTYFVNFMVPYIDEKCDRILDYIANRSSEEMKSDYYRLEEAPAPIVQPEPKAVVQPEATLLVEPEKAVYVTEVAPVKQEEPAKVIEKPEVRVLEKEEPREVMVEKIAVSYIPPVLDEKQAARLEEHLLELDPSLKRNEAKFYARHCTLGKKYTIAQCKKSLGCAYETARTTMEHLVELGYYRKEMVKNKHVYSPIPRD